MINLMKNLEKKEMGEDDIDVGYNNNSTCPYLSRRRDCDGDVERYCTKCEPCKHQVILIDCDGDAIKMCRE